MEETDRVTIRDVAVEANVGISTVSRVLNHSSKVATGTRERVLNVMQDMGYVPNEAAKELGKRRSQRGGAEATKVVGGDGENALPSVIFEGTWTPGEQGVISRALVGRNEDGPWLCVKSQLNEDIFFTVVRLEGNNEVATGDTFSEIISRIRPGAE